VITDCYVGDYPHASDSTSSVYVFPTFLSLWCTYSVMRVGIFSVFYEYVVLLWYLLQIWFLCITCFGVYVLYMLRLVFIYHFFSLLGIVIVPIL
jgi:hypothetical protein